MAKSSKKSSWSSWWEIVEQPDIIVSLNSQKKKGRGVWWGPKGPWKWTIENIQKELDWMHSFCLCGIEVEVDAVNFFTGKTKKVKKRIYPIFLYELSGSRWYSRKTFIKAIKELDDKEYWEDKSRFCATIEVLDEIIQSRLFRKGLEWWYNPTITKLGLSANHNRVTERTDNKNDTNIKVSPEEEGQIDDILDNN